VVVDCGSNYSTPVTLGNTQVVGLVLAGGQSLRMGQDKSKLRLNYKGVSLLEHAKQLLQETGLNSVLVSGSELDQIPDIFPNSGPLGGIHAAFSYVRNNYPHATGLLVIPVDMPNLTSDTLTTLLKTASGANTVVHFKDLNLPMYMPLQRTIFDYLEGALVDGGALSLYRLFAAVLAKTIPVPSGISHRELDNINYPAQWNDLNQ
tara:strand:+ start:446 stop:1060 length:615 start_codon:yes stop_codon:yes gene_type:complete